MFYNFFKQTPGPIRSRGLYVALHYQGWKRRVSC